ncbi:MAG: cytochrome d ubiquinol oxidase subunit II, partial [Gammaproteobacteria bacterium]|nr:cytochrome d ubiquinol oxidase subunit II [Gammaproteobacteria bacterium]
MEGGWLPLVWLGLIALAIFMYVLLDGFVLGIGILFPFAPSDEDRSTMMMSVAPIWDGNET